MLQKVNNPNILQQVKKIEIFEDIYLHVKILRHNKRSGRTMLFIHGGGAGTNHTIIERPARWMIDQDLYDHIILPDRRGCGASSPLTRKMTFRDQAEDMKALLSALNIDKPLDVIGISYGGPIALTQAYIDPRIQRVILYASSPTLNAMMFPWNLLKRTGLLSLYMRWVYKREIGKEESRYISLDAAYEQTSDKENWETYREVLRHTPKERLESELLQFEATLDPENAEIPEEVRLDIPVRQVIGDHDETWGIGVPEKYQERFSNFRHHIVPNAGHKDAIREADRFLKAIKEVLEEERHAFWVATNEKG